MTFSPIAAHRTHWDLALVAAMLLAQAPSTVAAAASLTRRVTFELTFANRDLVWYGDPASPTAQIYLKPGARPVATDVHVATLSETSASPARRYLREARIVVGTGDKVVYAFTPQREKVIGAIDGQGRFTPNDFYTGNRKLLPSWPADTASLIYDPNSNALYQDVALPGPVMTESLDFLPLTLQDASGKPVGGQFSIDYAAAGKEGGGQTPSVSLLLESAGKSVKLARATLPNVFRRDTVTLGSYDNKAGTYLPEAVYRAAGSAPEGADPSVTFTLSGEFTSALSADGPTLQVVDAPASAAAGSPATKIAIDGRFDDWRNVAGVDDPRGDIVPYLEYVPDVDLLEFKVANDDENIYLYARVAGQVGRTHPQGGRSYFYAYMDVDRDPGTGFLPTRDDDCYYGVDIGDDCEVQFEFVDNAFRKGFYGFCGIGGDENVLKQVVTLGASQYGKIDDAGNERADYKTEYTYRGGVTEITEDLKLGDSDTISVAVSPDGHEVEVSSKLSGFLKNRQGIPTVKLGQSIDLAVGMETDSKAYPGKTRWGADNTIPIRGYTLRPTSNRSK